jgi:hypothetical protein
LVSVRDIIKLRELPETLGVRVEAGHRADTDCEGRAVFDVRKEGGKEVRYSLTALWDETLPLLFGIGFNPATARASRGDQTVNRVLRAARSAGPYGGLFWVNLAAQMEVKSKIFIKEGRIEGRLNGQQIGNVLQKLHPEEVGRDLLLAWGGDGPLLSRWLANSDVHPRIRLFSLGLTENKRPRHPSRRKGQLKLERLNLPTQCSAERRN